MILRLTVWDVRAADGQDVEVVASPYSDVGTVLDALPVAVGDQHCYVGAELLDRQARLIDSPILPGAVISVGGSGPDFHAMLANRVGILEVISGETAGLAVALVPGTHMVCRDAHAAVTLRDSRVSREHAQLEIAPDGQAIVSDLGSANGTFLDGTKVTHPTRLTPKNVLRIGRSKLRWSPMPVDALHTTRGADGRLEFNRAFAKAPAVPPLDVALPTEQTVPSNTIAKVTTFVTPVAAGVVGAATSHNSSMLWMSVLGLIGPIGFSVAENVKRTEYRTDFDSAKKAVRAQFAGQARDERRVLKLLAPSPAQITLTASGMSPDLWSRGRTVPHGLWLRVGRADLPVSATLRGELPRDMPRPMVPDAPVTVDLRTTGVLGIVGAEEPAQGLLRWLLIQLGTLRTPDDLRMVVITGDGDELAWTRWLPHLDAGTAAEMPCRIGNTDETRAARIDELNRLITGRLADRRAAADTRFDDETVVVLDGALALRNLPGMKEILRDGPEVGVYVLCVDHHAMSECRGVCEVDADSLTLTRSRDEAPVKAKPESLTERTAERLARSLAPMRDRVASADRQSAIPYPVRLLDALGLPALTPAAVLTAWHDHEGPTTRITLGTDANGPAVVDLATQGPHTMLGGATGAGKSILLRTLVTSLLLANRPDELNLVLVDFKGGSAFLPFQHCPHVTALIRSTGETAADVFDDAAASRMLASIHAEVSRRESILSRYDGEIDHYWRARRATPDLPPLPRLVMILDEFARVLESSPDFLKALVNVAAKGRSLGIHLVLATQSLQGKLSTELRANISLRISLRQNEPADSTEVLGVPDAANLPGAFRGRGMIRCTTVEPRVPRLFQTGYLGDPPPSGETAGLTVRALDWPELGAARPAATTTGPDGLATDQDLVVAAIEQAAREAGVAPPFRPLLPALPANLPLAALESLAADSTLAIPPSAVPFGLADQPEAQSQPPALLDLAGSDRLLVAGGPQSGRTTFVRTLINSLTARFGPEQAHLYVIERHPSGLADLASLPHCGGVFSPAQPDRIRRLITWLDQETQRRSPHAAGAEAPGTAAATPSSRPFIVLVIDGWEHFEDRSNPNFAETSLTATLRGVIAVGAPRGVHVVSVGGQDMMSGKLPNLYGQRLLLPFPNEQTRRTYLGSRTTSPPPLPGRAVDAGTGRHVQICEPGDPPTASTPDHLDRDRLPKTFPALPTRISVDDLAPAPAAVSDSWIPLGLGGPDNDTIGVDLFETGPHLMLVSGPAESGRTGAAVGIIRSLRRAGIRVLAVAPPLSPLRRLVADDPEVVTINTTTVADTDLRDAVAGFGEERYAVVLDDADQITLQPAKAGYSDAPTLLEDIARPSALGHQALILVADAAPILSGQRRSLNRVANEVMVAGTRLLLTPHARQAAKDLGFTLEPDQYLSAPAGRGYLSIGRSTALIQLAAAD